MVILGLNFGHDGSAAIIRDGVVLSYITSERVTRKKKCRGITIEVLDYVLDKANLSYSDVEKIAICNLVGDVNFDLNPPESLFDRYSIGFEVYDGPNELTTEQLDSHRTAGTKFLTARFQNQAKPLYLCDHHLAHCAYAFYMSRFKTALAVSIDVSDNCGTNNSIFSFDTKEVNCLKHDSSFFPSMLYALITDIIGFHPSLVGAGKVMALATFGEPHKLYKRHVWHPGLPQDDVFYLQLTGKCQYAGAVWKY